MSPTIRVILHYGLVGLAFVAALGPAIAHLSDILPGSIYTDIVSFVAGAGTLNAWLTSSPLFQPLFQLKSPDQIIVAAKQRAQEENTKGPA